MKLYPGANRRARYLVWLGSWLRGCGRGISVEAPDVHAGGSSHALHAWPCMAQHVRHQDADFLHWQAFVFAFVIWAACH